MSGDRTFRWRPLGQGGLEHLGLSETADRITLCSALVGGTEDAPYGFHYEIELAADWTFRSLIVQRTDGVVLTLIRSADGAWHDNRGERPDLTCCIDIDISGTPATNTLPIRRTNDWPIGKPCRFQMAWLDLATMTIHKDGQIYTRLAPDRFRYEAADGSFAAEITVDPEGFVLDYPGLFERV